jgi:flagellar biosynthesis/type III secretory pathway protein FliH
MTRKTVAPKTKEDFKAAIEKGGEGFTDETMEACNAGYENGHEHGFDQGYAKGYREGSIAGFQAGIDL